MMSNANGAPKVGLDDYLVAEEAPVQALQALLDDALEADPLARAKAVKGSSDSTASALALLRDKSFSAGLHVAGPAEKDLTCAALRGLVKRETVENAVSDFRKSLGQATSNSASSKVEDDDPAIVADAEELLLDPELIERFLHDLHVDGLVGEEEAALTILLVMTTRITEKPVHAEIKGGSSGGKSQLVNKVTNLLPPSDLISITTMSPKALYYRENGIKHKVVLICEQEGGEEADYPLRAAMSEGNLTMSVAEKITDEDGTARIVTNDRVVEGPGCFITTTTKGVLHDENETRLLEITIDESTDQTRRIIDRQAQNAADPNHLDQEASHRRVEVWRKALGILDARQVQIPQALRLAADLKNADRLRSRRDFPKLLGMIAASALLHQRQRPVNGDQIIASDFDVELAEKLCASLWSPVPRHLGDLHAKLVTAFGTKEFSPSEAAKILGYADASTRKRLNDLESLGRVEQVVPARGNQPGVWKVCQ